MTAKAPTPLEVAGAEQTVGGRIRAARRQAGLTQRQLAAECQLVSPGARVSYAYLSRLEAGLRRPSVVALRAIAKALGTTSRFLETGHEWRCPHCGGPLDEAAW